MEEEEYSGIQNDVNNLNSFFTENLLAAEMRN
jgi:hypothetical protein